jgi:hypothetical protein
MTEEEHNYPLSLEVRLGETSDDSHYIREFPETNDTKISSNEYYPIKHGRLVIDLISLGLTTEMTQTIDITSKREIIGEYSHKLIHGFGKITNRHLSFFGTSRIHDEINLTFCNGGKDLTEEQFKIFGHKINWEFNDRSEKFGVLLYLHEHKFKELMEISVSESFQGISLDLEMGCLDEFYCQSHDYESTIKYRDFSDEQVFSSEQRENFIDHKNRLGKGFKILINERLKNLPYPQYTIPEDEE